MKNQKKSFIAKFYEDIMPVIYGLGAATVIIGAMYKLLNLNGASIILAVGLITEAMIFVLSIFEPKEKTYDWSRVYPELEETGERATSSKKNENALISNKLDEMFEQAKLDGALIGKLKNSMENFTQNVSNLGNLSSLEGVTSKYVASISKFSNSIEDIVTSAEKMSSVISSFQDINIDTSSMAVTFKSLDAFYKQELEHVEKRVKNIKDSSMSYSEVALSIQDADMSVLSLKSDISSLKSKLEELNGIYGKMLAAIKE